MLAKLAKQTEDNQKLQQELKGALTYPAVVFCILILTSGVMFGVVVPKLVTLFQDNNIQLPALTQAVLVVSNIMQNYWPILLVITALLFVAFQAYSQSEDGKFNTDLYKLRVPYFGNILQKYQLINFFSTLGLLMEAGTPIQKSFQILTRVLDNQVYKLKAFEIKARLQNGEKLATIMADTPFLFPDTASKMIEIGEKSATIDKMSLKLSQQYLQEIQYSLKNLTTVLGPIVIVIVGIFVAIFGLAILSPVFQLSQGVV
jgi:type IV pilus assembly protein PilC